MEVATAAAPTEVAGWSSLVEGEGCRCWVEGACCSSCWWWGVGEDSNRCRGPRGTCYLRTWEMDNKLLTKHYFNEMNVSQEQFSKLIIPIKA